jgi:Leucine-rich repeat (LRR) protein
LRQKLEQETSLRAKERPTEGKTLDGFCLLEASGVEFPDAARAAVLSEKHLTNVVFEDLSFFIELQYLDLSENTLPMEPFGILPNLRELRLSCNNISDLDVLEGFPTLNTLDLSYNSLTPGCVHALQQIQALRELDLCGNDLRELPPSMVHFVNLEKLLLENNKIEDNEIFFTLAGMPSLRILSLAYNFLSKIPVDSCGPRLYRYANDRVAVFRRLDLAYMSFLMHPNIFLYLYFFLGY